MFSGKRGSLRKALYKQRNKSDSNTGSKLLQQSPCSSIKLPESAPITPTTNEAPKLFVERNSNNTMLEDLILGNLLGLILLS